MIATSEVAELLHSITQGEILSYLNYTEILQLKAVILHIQTEKQRDTTHE